MKALLRDNEASHTMEECIIYYIMRIYIYVKRPYVQNIFLQQINSNEERQRQNFERFKR